MVNQLSPHTQHVYLYIHSYIIHSVSSKHSGQSRVPSCPSPTLNETFILHSEISQCHVCVIATHVCRQKTYWGDVWAHAGPSYRLSACAVEWSSQHYPDPRTLVYHSSSTVLEVYRRKEEVMVVCYNSLEMYSGRKYIVPTLISSYRHVVDSCMPKA